MTGRIMDNHSHKLKSIALRNTRSTLFAYAIPVCVYSGIAILLNFTTTPYVYFLAGYLVIVMFIGCSMLLINKVNHFTYDYGPKLLLGQILFWASIFPVWLLMLEEARVGGLLFSLTLLIYTFAYGSLKTGIVLNTFAVSCYLLCAYLGIHVLQQDGDFKLELLLVSAYLPVSLIIMLVGSKLAQKKHLVKCLLDEQTATQSQLESTLIKLKNAASTDELTGLLNRRELNSRLSYELTKAQRNQSSMALLLLDLDHFKNINDTYGHQCGDLVLKYVANCLTQHFRTTDSISRWGGEEFLILMPNTTVEEARQVSSRALQALESSAFHYNSHAINITASGGLCEMDNNSDLESILIIADERLYKAKANGRNQII